MTIDLWILVATVAFTWALIMADATFMIQKMGPMEAAKNRDDVPEPEGLHGRVHRTANNMKENLPLFAILVLVAHVSGEADAQTALGAQIFLGARIVHAGVYAAGIHGLRTAVWSVSIVGMFVIAAALL